jgi:hypothetical protein
VSRFTVEDGFTLRWMDIANGLHFRDLPRPRTGCPERSRYRVVEENDLVRVTQGLYYGRLIQVLRACVKASGRERVIAQENEGIGSGTWDAVFGLDRHWILLGRQSFDRYDACAGGVEIFPGPGRAGRGARSRRDRRPRGTRDICRLDQQRRATLDGAPMNRLVRCATDMAHLGLSLLLLLPPRGE